MIGFLTASELLLSHGSCGFLRDSDK